MLVIVAEGSEGAATCQLAAHRRAVEPGAIRPRYGPAAGLPQLEQSPSHAGPRHPNSCSRGPDIGRHFTRTRMDTARTVQTAQPAPIKTIIYTRCSGEINIRWTRWWTTLAHGGTKIGCRKIRCLRSRKAVPIYGHLEDCAASELAGNPIIVRNDSDTPRVEQPVAFHLFLEGTRQT
jgi:hypothetical protein